MGVDLRKEFESKHRSLESLFSGVRQVLELEGILNSILQALAIHDERLEQDGSRLAQLEQHEEVLAERFQTLTDQVREHEPLASRVSALELEKSSIQDALDGSVSGHLQNLEARMLVASDGRLAELEEKVLNLDRSVGSLSVQLAPMHEIRDAHAKAHAHGGWCSKADLNSLQQMVGETVSGLEAMSKGFASVREISTMDQRVAALEEQRTSLEEVERRLADSFEQNKEQLSKRQHALEQKVSAFQEALIQFQQAAELQGLEVDVPDFSTQMNDELTEGNVSILGSPRPYGDQAKEVEEPNSEPTPERQHSPRVGKKAPQQELVGRLKKIEGRLAAVENQILKGLQSEPELEKGFEKVKPENVIPAAQITQAHRTERQIETVQAIPQKVLEQLNAKMQISVDSVKCQLQSEMSKVASSTSREAAALKSWVHSEMGKFRTGVSTELQSVNGRIDAEATQKEQAQTELRQGQRHLSAEIQRIEMQFTAVSTNCLACGMHTRPTETQTGLGSLRDAKKPSLGRNDVGAPVTQFLTREWEIDQYDTTRKPLRKGGGFNTTSNHFYNEGSCPTPSLSPSKSSPAVGPRRKREVFAAAA